MKYAEEYSVGLCHMLLAQKSLPGYEGTLSRQSCLSTTIELLEFLLSVVLVVGCHVQEGIFLCDAPQSRAYG